MRDAFQEVSPPEPHFVVCTDDGNAHVIPKETFDALACGRLKWSDVDDHEALLRKITGEWAFERERAPLRARESAIWVTACLFVGVMIGVVVGCLGVSILMGIQ